MGGTYICQLKVTPFLLGKWPFFQEFFHFPLQRVWSVCTQGFWEKGSSVGA